MFNRHRIVTTIAAAGLLPVAGHLLLGPDVVTPPFAFVGLIVAAGAGVYLAVRSVAANGKDG